MAALLDSLIKKFYEKIEEFKCADKDDEKVNILKCIESIIDDMMREVRGCDYINVSDLIEIKSCIEKAIFNGSLVILAQEIGVLIGTLQQNESIKKDNIQSILMGIRDVMTNKRCEIDMDRGI